MEFGSQAITPRIAQTCGVTQRLHREHRRKGKLTGNKENDMGLLQKQLNSLPQTPGNLYL